MRSGGEQGLFSIAFHNGGLILFGPDDMLYVGLGDGGNGGDLHNYGQSTATLLGKLLRLDVDVASRTAFPLATRSLGSRKRARRSGR